MNNPIHIFDRNLIRRRRDRAAEGVAGFDFLLQDVADRLVERLDIVRKEFPLILDLGAHHGVLSQKLRQRQGTDTVVASDISYNMVKSSMTPSVVADEEFLPFAANSLDAVVSNMSLQCVNDLPGAMAQIRMALKPDGLFMAAVPGGRTLHELRTAMMEAELSVTGGASPRVSPFIDLRDMAGLLQRAGFALPVADSDVVTVDYSSPLKLMQDLRGMGATNAVADRLKKPMRRRVLMEAARIYQEKFGDSNCRIPATFEIVYAIGWKPHDSQQKPMKPGTAAVRLADALGAEEKKADDKVSP